MNTGVKRIAILTSGGDAPGMNAAVRAAALLAIGQKVDVVGVERGYQGLLEDAFRPLGVKDVAGIIREGGTVLGSARCLEFHERTARDRARKNLAHRNVDALLVIGGNGSLAGLQALTDPAENSTGLKGVGIPASIDNDVGATRLAIGVDTAVNTIVDACDKISDTASAHNRTFIVEVMGRQCGYLAMSSAIASAANAVLFPEMERSEDEIVELVGRAVLHAQNRTERSRRVLVIKAEGVPVTTQRLKERLDTFCREHLGDTPKVETRITVLGHVVRGGRPSALDRQIASRLAHVAVRALLEGENRIMAAWLAPASLRPGLAQPAPSDPQCSLVNIDRVLEETRAMLDGTSEFVKWRKKLFREIEEVLVL